MDMRYESEELDQESLEYLRDVHQREGRGFPGVYLDSSQAKLYAASMPWWALGCGPLIIILTLFLTWGSFKSPNKVAYLMTAGFFLGGWMVIAWLRCLIARQRNDYIGHFKYIDPLYLWYGTGRGVWVTPVSMVTRAETNHQHDGEGNYKSSTVTIHRADGRTDVEVNGTGKAELLEAYVNELADVRSGTPAERGYQAIDRVHDRDYDDDDRRGRRRVEHIPEPHKVRSSFWWLRYLIVFGSVVPLFFLCRTMASFSRDAALFREFKDKKHPEVRAYLQDPRNTRHRKEMLARLERFHLDAASRLDAANVPAPGVKEGLKSVITGVQPLEWPLVTVRFYSSGKGGADPATHVSKDVLGTLNRDMIKTLSDRLGAKIGANDLLDFAESSEEGAVIEVNTVVTLPEKDAPPGSRAKIEWTVTFQPNPSAEKRTAKFSAEEVAGKDTAGIVRQLYKQFADKFLPQ